MCDEVDQNVTFERKLIQMWHQDYLPTHDRQGYPHLRLVCLENMIFTRVAVIDEVKAFRWV